MGGGGGGGDPCQDHSFKIKHHDTYLQSLRIEDTEYNLHIDHERYRNMRHEVRQEYQPQYSVHDGQLTAHRDGRREENNSI